jgi:hypothetical protein
MTITDLLASYDLNGQLTSLEDLIAQGADKRMVLRMLILANLTFGGIKTKQLENIKREVLQVTFHSNITPSIIPSYNDKIY